MNRREFLKSALTLAMLAPVARLTGAEDILEGNAAFDAPAGKLKVTRRHYKDTALTVPLLGFGGMRFPTNGAAIDKEAVKKLFAKAMEAGLNYFDTAYFYHGGESEKCIGEVLKEDPRDSYLLTDKMPVWVAKDEAGLKRIFNEQLEKCKTDYFDFYLLHSLNAGNWELAQKIHAFEYLERMKKEGKIRKLGFSFHDSPEVLQKIVDARKWDVVQLQINYLDWELYRSREQYEIAVGTHGRIRRRQVERNFLRDALVGAHDRYALARLRTGRVAEDLAENLAPVRSPRTRIGRLGVEGYLPDLVALNVKLKNLHAAVPVASKGDSRAIGAYDGPRIRSGTCAKTLGVAPFRLGAP